MRGNVGDKAKLFSIFQPRNHTQILYFHLIANNSTPRSTRIFELPLSKFSARYGKAENKILKTFTEKRRLEKRERLKWDFRARRLDISGENRHWRCLLLIKVYSKQRNRGVSCLFSSILFVNPFTHFTSLLAISLKLLWLFETKFSTKRSIGK